MLRSDNEPAIVALLKESLKALRMEGVVEQASEEHPPPYDSQANGCIEIGVKSVPGHMRTLQVALQSTIGYNIPCRHPIMSWLASHAAGILTNFVRGSDGRTAYQRVRGKPFASKVIAFAERCRYKSRSKEQLQSPDRWYMGVYLGRERLTGQHILFDVEKGSVAYARTLMRLPNVEKWHKDSIAAVRATPYDLHASKEPEVIFREQTEKAEPTETPVVQARRVYIRASDLEGPNGFGYTEGCPKCDHMLRYGSGFPTGKKP